ncbi:MAG: TetR/AcrR family transcriptional regulator [Bacteroidia bacterium]
MVKEQNTEKIILDASREIFHTKGMAGARMQEIADKAGINKALLHYYYRSKDKLFEAILVDTIQRFFPTVRALWESDFPLFQKIENFVHGYIDLLKQNSFMPSFILQELNLNPDFLKTMMEKQIITLNPMKFFQQIEDEVQRGIIVPIAPMQLITNMLALSIFPFMAKPMITGFLHMHNDDFNMLMEMRKKDVTEFIINSIRVR